MQSRGLSKTSLQSAASARECISDPDKLNNRREKTLLSLGRVVFGGFALIQSGGNFLFLHVLIIFLCASASEEFKITKKSVAGRD